jgi:hypothetical protein
MKIRIGTVIVVLVLGVLCQQAVAGEWDVLAALVVEEIEGARINLNPWGGHLGFEMEIDGDDPRLAALVSVIRSAEPARGHKCPNRGAIRFQMSDGGVFAVGLLPSHSSGIYNLRLYAGDRLQGVCRLDRAPFLEALEELGVPMDDPAFQESAQP